MVRTSQTDSRALFPEYSPLIRQRSLPGSASVPSPIRKPTHQGVTEVDVGRLFTPRASLRCFSSESTSVSNQTFILRRISNNQNHRPLTISRESSTSGSLHREYTEYLYNLQGEVVPGSYGLWGGRLVLGDDDVEEEDEETSCEMWVMILEDVGKE